MNIRAQIGNRIRGFRIKKSMTIEKLAFKSGVHYNYLGDIERGARNPSIESLVKIADGLNVKVGEFFENLAQGKTASGRKNESYRITRSIITLLKDKSPGSRRFIISMVKKLSSKIK